MKHIVLFCYILSIMIGISTITFITSIYFKSKIKYLQFYVIYLWVLLVTVLFNFTRTYLITILSPENTFLLLLTFMPHFILITSFSLMLVLIIHQLTETAFRWYEKLYCIGFSLYTLGMMTVPWFIYKTPERIYAWYFHDMSNTPTVLIYSILSLLALVITGVYFSRIKFPIMKKILIYYFSTSVIVFVGGNFAYQYLFSNPNTPQEFKETIDIALAFILFFDIFMVVNYLLFMRHLFGKNNIPENSVIDIFCQNYHISRREKDVLNLVIHRLTNQKIAEGLFLSTKTIETHLSSIYKKTGVSGKEELTALYESYKLMTVQVKH